jgi:hypothetical protein
VLADVRANPTPEIVHMTDAIVGVVVFVRAREWSAAEEWRATAIGRPLETTTIAIVWRSLRRGFPLLESLLDRQN